MPSRQASRPAPATSLRRAAALALGLILAGGPASAYETYSPVRSDIASRPIAVVAWVLPGVTLEDEQRVLADIRSGLDSWQEIPTSCLAFEIVNVVHSASEPATLPEELLVRIGNAADLPSGGAYPPQDGYPGWWTGAVADNPDLELVPVATHEIGHAVGLGHSTVSPRVQGDSPIMHWALGSPVPTADDIAVVSTLYPQPDEPIGLRSATLRGRLVSASTGRPVSGVSVVLVDEDGRPSVGRLSGGGGQAPGEFVLEGVPPGTRSLRLLDGWSYRGIIPPVEVPSDGLTAGGMRGGFQADNFSSPDLPPGTLEAGETRDLGELPLEILPMQLVSAHSGPLELLGGYSGGLDGDILDPVAAGRALELWLPIVGGLRDLAGTAIELPSGLAGVLSGDVRGVISGVHGSHFLHVWGTPTEPGLHPIRFRLVDAQDEVAELTAFLPVVDRVRPREVSAPGAFVPLIVRNAGFALRLSFEAVGADGYNVHAGVIGDWGSHAADASGCDAAVTEVPGGRILSTQPTVPGRNEYFLVTAWNGPPDTGLEGPIGTDSAGAPRLAGPCPPDG